MVGRASERYQRLTTAAQGQNGEEVPVFLQKVFWPLLMEINKKKTFPKNSNMNLTCPSCRSCRRCRRCCLQRQTIKKQEKGLPKGETIQRKKEGQKN